MYEAADKREPIPFEEPSPNPPGIAELGKILIHRFVFYVNELARSQQLIEDVFDTKIGIIPKFSLKKFCDLRIHTVVPILQNI